mgnify:CR=1 FL=1
MHILIVPSEYPTNDHRLGGIFTQEQAKYLSKSNKVGVIYIYLFSFKKIFSRLFFKIFSLEKIKKNRIYFYFPRIPLFKLINYYTHYFFFLRVFKKYIYENGKPNLIHVHFSEFAAYSAYKIFQKYGIPYIITEHSTDYLDGKIELKYKKGSKNYSLLKKIVSSSGKVIAVSTFLNKKLKKFFDLKQDKLITIPNTSLTIKNKNLIKVFDFIFVGTLEDRKNPIKLLRVFKNICENKNLKLAIVGSGPLLNKCENFIKSRKLGNNVKIFTKLGRSQVMNLINKSKALVSTSSHETFGIVMIEALSQGVPIISFNNGGVLDIINKKNGILVRNKSDKELRKSLNLFIKNYNKFDKAEIIKFYKKKFLPRIVIKKINKIYKLTGLK